MNELTHIQETQNEAAPGFIAGSRLTGPLTDVDPTWNAPAGHASRSEKPRKARGGTVSRLLLLAGMLMLGMLFGGAGAGAVLLVAGPAAVPTSTPTASNVATAPIQPVNMVETNTIANVYAKVSPSVVEIHATFPSRGRGGATRAATGTGFVLDKEGNILTNSHVVDGAASVSIVLSDGSEYAATVIGTSPQDDLAVIRTSAPADRLAPAVLGNSSEVRVGNAVIAIGYPYGLEQTVTSGIVSGIGRDSQGQGSAGMDDLIQIDAAINPGNSGGPLLNTAGQVIGINTLIQSPVEGFTGVGFAIPIDHAKDLLPQLMQ